LDGTLRVPIRARIFKDHPRTLVFCSGQASRAKEKALSRRGAWVFRVPKGGKMLSLKAVLKVLRSLGVGTLLVEGGGEVHASFLREGLADEAVLFMAPRKVGAGPYWDLAKVLPSFKDLAVEKVGEDFLLRGNLKF
jgi:riboflavin biosynthesis pyrimidine reductase